MFLLDGDFVIYHSFMCCTHRLQFVLILHIHRKSNETQQQQTQSFIKLCFVHVLLGLKTYKDFTQTKHYSVFDREQIRRFS